MDEDLAPTPLTSTSCWKCGKTVEAHRVSQYRSLCSFCSVPAISTETNQNLYDRQIEASRSIDIKAKIRHSATGFKVLLWTYGFFLINSVIFAIIQSDTEEWNADDALIEISTIEIIDSLAILFCCSILWKKFPLLLKAREQSWSITKISAWSCSILTACLVINYLYHYVLLAYINPSSLDTDIIIAEYGLSYLVIITYCLQPAIIEELFFRRLAIPVLQSSTSTGTAIYLSSLMFGLAHLHSPLSIPILFIIGLGLGILYVKTQKIWPSIIVHFLHNFLITWYTVHPSFLN